MAVEGVLHKRMEKYRYDGNFGGAQCNINEEPIFIIYNSLKNKITKYVY